MGQSVGGERETGATQVISVSTGQKENQSSTCSGDKFAAVACKSPANAPKFSKTAGRIFITFVDSSY